MKASGATSITRFSSSLCYALVLDQVEQRVVERAQIGIDLILQIARQKAELSRRPRPPAVPAQCG